MISASSTRFAQVLVLLHVTENETKRVAGVESGAGLLEADGGVFHPLHAARVFGARLGEKVRLDAAGGLGIGPPEVGGVDVNRDEQIAAVLVGDAAAVVERDQRVARARVDDVDVRAPGAAPRASSPRQA